MKAQRAAAALLLSLIGSYRGGAACAAVVSLEMKTHAGAAVEDAVVVLDPLDAAAPPTHAKAIIDQINKRFVPKVSVVRTGTAVTFPNSDHIRHQVYSFSPAKPFTLKLYAGSPMIDVEFDKPGLIVLGCNIHDTMSAFLAVVDSPYFAKTAASGSAQLNVPPGRYRLRVWHPKLTLPFAPREITVTTAPLELPVVADLNAAGESVAAWPD